MAFLRNKKCKGNDYYVMVENRRINGKVKQYTLETIGTWDKVNHLKIDPDSMTFQHFWDQMDGLTQEQLDLAEDTITETITGLFPDDLDFLSLDYTNYYTFVDSNNTRNDICRRGHNKQKRNDLRQFSLAVVTTKASGIPLITHLYKGNCSFSLSNAKSLLDIDIDKHKKT